MYVEGSPVEATVSVLEPDVLGVQSTANPSYEAAWAEIEGRYRQPHDVVERVARKMIFNPEDVKDARQQAYLRAIIGAHSYTPGTNIDAWLTTDAQNVCKTQLKNSGKRLEVSGELFDIALEQQDDRQAAEYDVTTHLEQRDFFANLKRNMNPDFYDAVVAVHVQGLPGKTVAAEQNIPVGTVLSRVHRGVKQIRDLIDKGLVEVPSYLTRDEHDDTPEQSL